MLVLVNVVLPAATVSAIDPAISARVSLFRIADTSKQTQDRPVDIDVLRKGSHEFFSETLPTDQAGSHPLNISGGPRSAPAALEIL